MDGSPGRLAVFDDVIRKNTKIRFFYNLYEKSPDFLKSVLLILYGFKCYVSVNWAMESKAKLAFFASYPNEHVVLNHVRGRLNGLPAAELTVTKRNILRWGALDSLPAFLHLLPRLWRVACRLARSRHFLPACRVLSTLTFYTRFRCLLDSSETRAVFIANHYSPECLALAAAAHRFGGKVLFANHASATWRSGYVPQLHCDLAVVTSQAVLDTYTRDRGATVKAVFLPLSLPQRPMRSSINVDDEISVGIFLTALTNIGRLRKLLAALQSNPRVRRILIRSHPAQIVNEDLSEFLEPDSGVEDTTGTSLFDNLNLCDVAICGNSTVTIELLRGGVPVFYHGDLDRLLHDYNGYLEHGLVPPMPDALNDAALENLRLFYEDSSWLEKLRYFDAGYQQNEDAMLNKLGEAVCGAIQERRGAFALRDEPFQRGSDGIAAAKLRERPFRI